MKKILVVDDDEDIAISVKKGLMRKGFDVDMYTDPQKALAEFKAETYDLLLLDIRMPKINGFQLYREIIRKDSKVRVCFLTAFEEYREEFNKAFPELDDDRFIKKPTDLTSLADRLARELEIAS
jgi:DNA-binding response OmpR family regulator